MSDAFDALILDGIRRRRTAVYGPPVFWAVAPSSLSRARVWTLRMRLDSDGVLTWDFSEGWLRERNGRRRSPSALKPYLPPCWTMCCDLAVQQLDGMTLKQNHGQAVECAVIQRIRQRAPQALAAQPEEIKEAIAALVLLEGA